MTSGSIRIMLRPLLVGISILVCFSILAIVYSTSVTYRPMGSIATTDTVRSLVSNTSNEKDIIVLVWHWPFGCVSKLTRCTTPYNIKGCFVTDDRKFYSKADAVIMHHRDIANDLSNLPQQQRPYFQKWIWFNMESPTHCSKLPGINNLFNLTCSYRLDSDIPARYGSIAAAEGEQDFVLPSKNKTVCWLVSHWNEEHARVKYYKELKKHIEIHVYGNAIGERLPKDETLPTIASCKFYLSFENSLHVDYITEKFFNPLQVGTVPVVLGPTRQSYEKLIKGDAFIHVNDFGSAKELADYLLVLDKNDEMYLKYFGWRRYFKINDSRNWACMACDYLHIHKEYKIINNLNKWFWE